MYSRLLHRGRSIYRNLSKYEKCTFDKRPFTSKAANGSNRVQPYRLPVAIFGVSVGVAIWVRSSRCEEAADQRTEGKGPVRTTAWEEVPTKSCDGQRTLEQAISESHDLIKRIKDESGSPGIVVAVSVDGKSVWSEGLGYADVENRVPCTAKSVMRIASISKSITMATVAKLWESGKLDLDKPVQDYVSSFPEKKFENEKVTLTTRMLVSHLSGIRHYEKKKDKDKKDQENEQTKSKSSAKETVSKTDDNKEKPKGKVGEFHMKEYYIKRKFDTVNEALDLFKDDPLMSKPGSEFLYTTHGWTLVSAVIEGATGKKFTKVVQELFKDLGLTNTYLDENEPIIYNRARNYVKNKRGRLVNARYVDNSYKWAGGGFLSTVGDLVYFGDAMLYSYQCDPKDGATAQSGKTKNQRLTGNKLAGYLKPETMQMIWSGVENTKCSWDTDGLYGMGWAVIPEEMKFGAGRHQRFYVSHTGGAIGASSVLLVLPRQQKVMTLNPEPMTLTSKKMTSIPQGVCVAIIVNMQSIGLNKTALEIGKIFESVQS